MKTSTAETPIIQATTKMDFFPLKNHMRQMLLSLPTMRVGQLHFRHCRKMDLRTFTPQWRAGGHFCHYSPGAAGCRGVEESHPRGVEGWVVQAAQGFVGELLGGVVHDQSCRVMQDVEENQQCQTFLQEREEMQR